MSNLTTIDTASLEAVTGGKDHHSYGSNNTATLDALNGISSSLASIRNNQGSQSQGGGLFNNPTNMMLFAMCLANRPAPGSNVVVVPRW